MPGGKVANVMFAGTKDLKFVDQSIEWGFVQPTLSNGAAYADLDNDGDLDIVVNNINAPASVYQNNIRKKEKSNYLQIQLQGERENRFGYGSKLIVKTKNELQLNYVTATRGFESASAAPIHFGLGEHDKVDTLEIIWPDGEIQTVINVAANQQLTLMQKDAKQSVKKLIAPHQLKHAL